MKWLSLIVLIALAEPEVHAQLYFRNHSETRLRVAFAARDIVREPSTGGWITMGWYWVNPGQTVVLYQYLPKYGYGRYYAEDSNGVSHTPWQSGEFLVAPADTFSIVDASDKRLMKAHPEFRLKGFGGYNENTEEEFGITEYTIEHYDKEPEKK